MKKYTYVILLTVAALINLAVFFMICDMDLCIKNGNHLRNSMRQNGMVLEYQTNAVIQNPDGLGQWRLAGDVITLQQGSTVTKIGENDGKYLVWYEPRFFSAEVPNYRGAILFWDPTNYNTTIDRQRSLRIAVSNALAFEPTVESQVQRAGTNNPINNGFGDFIWGVQVGSLLK